MPARKPRPAPDARPRGPKSDKPWHDALKLEVHREVAKGKENKLSAIARRVVKLALDGDMRAVQEIGDRLEGRATQAVNIRRIGSFEDLTDEELAALARE